MDSSFAQEMKDLQEEIREENKFLHKALQKKIDWFNIIIGILGTVLALAGVVALVFSILTDKKINKIADHIQEVHQTVHATSTAATSLL